MLKVLHVLTDTNIGGAGKYIATYLKYCDTQRVSPAVLVPRGSDAINVFPKDHCNIIEADIAPDKSLDMPSIPIIKNIIKKENFDLVHAHGSASARLAAKGVCKCVFTKHTLSGPSFGIKSLFSKLIYRLPGGFAIAVSDIAADNLVKLGFDRKKIFTVLNGVEDIGVPTAQKRVESKKSFGIDSSKFVVGCVARFHPVKDYPTLLNSAKLICEKCDKIAFLFVGDGPELNNMKTLAKNLGIYSKCVFAGRLYDTERAYHAMDLYSITSKHESFGLSLAEAWSAGLPSVISDADGFKEISTDGVTSIICKSGDCRAVADAVLRVYYDTELASALSQNGLLRYRDNYSGEIFANNIENVYYKICK